MTQLLLNVILPLYLLVGLGFLIGKAKPQLETKTISFLVLYLFAPALIFSSFREVSISLKSFTCIFLTALGVFVLVLAASAAVEKVLLGKRNPAFELSATVMNAGYLGIPLIYLMFGEPALPIAVNYMVVMAVLHFTLGIAVLNSDNLREGLKAALKIPLVYAAVLSFLLKGVYLPPGIEKTLKLTGNATMPLMLVSIGISLSRISVEEFKEAVAATAVRFVGGAASAAAVVSLLKCPPQMAKALIVQSALPSAILNYVLCEQFNRSPRLAASVIFVSTVTFPFFLLILQAALGRL
ncbi:AEC family transporter [Thermovibrio ammonificans]